MGRGDCTIQDFFQWFNIALGVALIGFGIYQCVTDYGDKIGWDNIWGIVAPIYSILFGGVLIGSEMKVRVIHDYLRFLRNYFGRGLFNIFLATLVLASLNESDENGDNADTFDYEVVTFILSGVLFFIGVTYTCVYCCCRGNENSQDQDSRDGQDEDDLRS